MLDRPAQEGDICIFWNKLVIVHKVDTADQWAEVLKIRHLDRPRDVVGEPFNVRLSHLTLVQEAPE